jgi:hypothetical protein
MTRIPIPSVDSSPGMKLLPTLLSINAGSIDAIGFPGLSPLVSLFLSPLAPPMGLAPLALAMGLAAHLDGGQRP